MKTDRHKGAREPMRESQDEYSKIESARRKELSKWEKRVIFGFRKEFLNYVENTNMSIEQSMEQFLAKHEAFKKDDLITWLREEMKNKKISAQVLVKVKTYLNSLQEKEEKTHSVDDGSDGER